MKKVYKYVLKATDEQVVEIPSIDILSVESQLDNIVVYALVDIDNPIVNCYTFRVYGTGHDIKNDIDSFKFLGTVKMHNGSLMFHVFYKNESSKLNLEPFWEENSKLSVEEIERTFPEKTAEFLKLRKK